MANALILRLSPEFGCWPLWDDATGDNLDPADLPIPAALLDRIKTWDDAFQATLDPSYPPDSRFPTEADEQAWLTEGDAVFEALVQALGPDRVRRRDPSGRQP